MKRNPFKFTKKPKLENSYLFAAWSEDSERFETDILGFLKEKLSGNEICRILPTHFFPLDGVQVKNDVAHIPECKFYLCEKDLLLFTSDPPQNEWYRFFNAVLDVAEIHCRTKEVYTIGKIISIRAHTNPRELFGIFSTKDFQTELSEYGISRTVDYVNPNDQRPTLSSYFLWVAKKRNIKAVSLWVTVPFYLIRTGDPKARKKIIEFIDKRFDLGIDFTEIDKESKEQGERLGQLRTQSPKIEDLLNKLESNLMLTEEESIRLVNEVEEFLGT